jgi:hypothetical protein
LPQNATRELPDCLQPLAKLCLDPSSPERVDGGAEAIMRHRWSDVLERDPYYNPNLSRERADFSLGK